MNSAQIKQSEQTKLNKNSHSKFGFKQNPSFIGPSSETFNASFLYTPTQYLISNFLTAKKTVEDDLIVTLKGMTEMRSKKQLSTLQLKQQLSAKKKQLEAIKRKLNKSCQQQMQVFDVMRKRINKHEICSHKTPRAVRNTTQFDFSTQNHQKKQKEAQNIQSSETQHDRKDCQTILSYRMRQKQLLDLDLNKQIAFFMLEQSVSRQNLIKLKQRREAQTQKKIQQHNNGNVGNHGNNLNAVQNYHFNNEVKNELSKSGLSMGLNQHSQINHGDYYFQQPNQNYYPPVQPLQPESINNYLEGMFELESFFQIQQIELESIDQMRERPHKNKYQSKHKIDRIEKNQTQKQLPFTYQNIFKQEEFIRSIDQKKLSMDVEPQQKLEKQDGTPNIHGQRTTSSKSHFEGQIELQCLLYRKKVQISADILLNQLSSVNQFLYQNSHMIKRHNSDLQFWVILCQAAELIKSNIDQHALQAIQIVRNKVSKMNAQIQNWHKNQLFKLTRMLLIDPAQIHIQPYLTKVEESFRQTFQLIYRLPDLDRFIHTLYTGALILKTPTCVQKDKQNPLICPLCHPLAENIFTSIPLLTRNQSNLICRINGSVMDHENYPLMLPSSQIYSYKGLQETKNTVKLNGGKVTQQYYCKFTQTWYEKDRAKKVYLA